ncbi:YciI family protein [Streptomyces sp. NPDC101112]|uniref:YciI family protein n=1 Tax=Streptomyces sp. NPDC101112 TaxID=3366105 RepID=UPI003828FC2A
MYFFVRADNPRPTFHLDMTPQEREIMAKHVDYWTERAKDGISVVFGPVAAPEGFFGVGVYKVDDEAHMRQLLAQDPANGLLTFEILPMANAVVGHEVRYPDLP